MEDTSKDYAFLVRYAASIGSSSYNWVVIVFAILFLPLGWALILSLVLVSVEQVSLQRYRSELRPIIKSMMSFAKTSDIEKLIRLARTDQGAGTPAVRLGIALSATLRRAKKRDGCYQGHMLGCEHRQVKENETWPELLREAVRKGNDASI